MQQLRNYKMDAVKTIKTF